MPNHCHNRVSFYGDSESEIQKLHDIFSKGLENDDEVDTGTVFGHFIPEPDWSTIPLHENDVKEYSFSNPRGKVGECPKMIIDKERPFRSGLRFESTDVMDDRWYNWRVQNWGTKWDCYTLEIDDTDLPHGFEAVSYTHLTLPTIITV